MSRKLLNVLLAAAVYAFGCASPSARDSTVSLLASSLYANIEKADRVENIAESNMAKINEIEVALASAGSIVNQSDPVQTVTYAVIAISFLFSCFYGTYRLVGYLLRRAECRFKDQV